VGVGLAVGLGEGEVVQVVRLRQHLVAERDDERVLGGVLLGEGEGRLLELQAVDEHHVGVLHVGGDARRGSKVWLLVPSGTMPVISAASPATFATIEVMGATVVTMRRRPSPASCCAAASEEAAEEASDEDPQAVRASATSAAEAGTRRFGTPRG
jgi:hypothetical protein